MVDHQSDTNNHFSEDNFKLLLAKIPVYTDASQATEIVESLRVVAEFICYSEQNNLNHFDTLMATDVLLVDMPRLLLLDSQQINTQLIQTASILVQNIKDLNNLTVLLGCDILRQLVDVDVTFTDELVDYYISFLKTLVMKLKNLPHLMMLFYNPTLKVYPLFMQSQ